MRVAIKIFHIGTVVTIGKVELSSTFPTRFDRSVLMFKICPESLHAKCAERSSISKYDTRNKPDLQIPRLNLDLRRKVLVTLV